MSSTRRYTVTQLVIHFFWPHHYIPNDLASMVALDLARTASELANAGEDTGRDH